MGDSHLQLRILDERRAYSPLRCLKAGWDFLRRWPVLPVVVLGTLIILTIFASQIAPHSFRETDLRQRNRPPIWMEGGGSERILGGDVVGRDILSRLIHGARVSVMVAGISLVTGAIFGTALGLIARNRENTAAEIEGRGAVQDAEPAHAREAARRTRAARRRALRARAAMNSTR